MGKNNHRKRRPATVNGSFARDKQRLGTVKTDRAASVQERVVSDEKKGFSPSKLWSKTLAGYYFVATTVGLIALFLLNRIDVSVERDISFDPNQPFATQFVVQNASPFSIHNVRPACGFSPGSMNGGFHIDRMDIGSFSHPLNGTLEPGAKTTIDCPVTNFQSGLDSLKLEIVTRYTCFWLKRCKASVFKGKPVVGSSQYAWIPLRTESCEYEPAKK